MATERFWCSQQPFEEIVDEHCPPCCACAEPSWWPVDAEDAWSEDVLAALRAYPRLHADSNIEAWL